MHLLRKSARLLGAVRDLDVAIAKLERHQQKTRGRNKADRQETLRAWRSQRAVAFAALLKWLDSAKHARFVVDFLVFCRTPGAGIVDMQPQPGKKMTPFQVRHVAPTMLVAKIASDMRKPDGLVVVAPGTEAAFLAPLPGLAITALDPYRSAAAAHTATGLQHCSSARSWWRWVGSVAAAGGWLMMMMCR